MGCDSVFYTSFRTYLVKGQLSDEEEKDSWVKIEGEERNTSTLFFTLQLRRSTLDIAPINVGMLLGLGRTDPAPKLVFFRKRSMWTEENISKNKDPLLVFPNKTSWI